MTEQADIPALLIRLHHVDAEVRRDAVVKLRGHIARPEAEHAVRLAIHDNDGLVRMLAAEALARARVCPEEAIPVLIAVLEAADQAGVASAPNAKDWRRVAAGALEHYGPRAEPAIPALRNALLDPDQNVRGYAALSLGAIGPAAIVAMQDLRVARQSEAEEQMRPPFDEAIRKIARSDHFIVITRTEEGEIVEQEGHPPAQSDESGTTVKNTTGESSTHVQRITGLVELGITSLEKLIASNGGTGFDDWAEAMHSAAKESKTPLSDEYVRWLWGLIIDEPLVLARYQAVIDRSAEPKTYLALPAGSTLRVKLFNITTGHRPNPQRSLGRIEPEVQVELIDDLNMKRGKKRRLECCPVGSRLRMRIWSGVGSADDEAALMKVKPQQVQVDGHDVLVTVGSLNQAFTRASLRLETNRLSNSGRVYDLMYWQKPAGGEVLLESIRHQLEEGVWKPPEASKN